MTLEKCYYIFYVWFLEAYLHKVLELKDLKQITVIGTGLLGGSISLTALRTFPDVKVVAYAHRSATRQKAKVLAVASEIVGDIKLSVSNADLVTLATPIHTFEKIFGTIAEALPKGCIVTDVGSTKVLPHRWAAKKLPSTVHYVGSHPIAGSEKRGIEFARDDMFENAICILTTTKGHNTSAVRMLKKFWSALGCSVYLMKPARHDKIFANISHLPHIAAAALVNSSNTEELKLAGKGFIDTSRIASGPANIWADVLFTNVKNTAKGIDKIIAELLKIKKAIESGDKKEIGKLLKKARDKRAAMIKYKLKKNELIP